MYNLINGKHNCDELLSPHLFITPLVLCVLSVQEMFFSKVKEHICTGRIINAQFADITDELISNTVQHGGYIDTDTNLK